MIYAPTSSNVVSKDMPLAVNTTLSADGQAMVGVLDTNGKFGVKPSTGAAGEKFVGFLNAQTSMVPFQQSTTTKVEQVVLGPSGAFTLAKVPVGGTTSIHNVTDGTTITSGFTLDSAGNFLSVANANKEVRFTYTIPLTAIEARGLFGDPQPGGYSGYQVGQAAVARQGTIYIDQFDSSVDWSLATGVKLAAGGKVTNQAGSGVTIDAVIVEVPSVDKPYLGLEFAAAGA